MIAAGAATIAAGARMRRPGGRCRCGIVARPESCAGMPVSRSSIGGLRRLSTGYSRSRPRLRRDERDAIGWCEARVGIWRRASAGLLGFAGSHFASRPCSDRRSAERASRRSQGRRDRFRIDTSAGRRARRRRRRAARRASCQAPPHHRAPAAVAGADATASARSAGRSRRPSAVPQHEGFVVGAGLEHPLQESRYPAQELQAFRNRKTGVAGPADGSRIIRETCWSSGLRHRREGGVDPVGRKTVSIP